MSKLAVWVEDNPYSIAIVIVLCFAAVLLVGISTVDNPCRERVASPGVPCEWHSGRNRYLTKLEIRGAVAICTCEIDK